MARARAMYGYIVARARAMYGYIVARAIVARAI